VLQPSANDTFHDRIAVAAIDLLGVGDLLETDSDAIRAMDACEHLIGQVVIGQHAYETEELSASHIDLFKNRMYFGDSIYLFADPSDPLDQQVEKLLALAATVIWIGLLSYIRQEKKRFLARAGIAVGNLRVRAISATSAGLVFPIGTSMSRAHIIESNQDWIGGALPSVLPSHHGRPYRVPYKVPMRCTRRKERANQELEAINWIQAAVYDERYDETSLLQDIERIASQQHDLGIRTKWENTAAFVEAKLQDK
jgi:hypothetical protein